MLAIVHKNLLAKFCFFCSFSKQIWSLGKLVTSRSSYLKLLISCCCLQNRKLFCMLFQILTKKMNRFANYISSLIKECLDGCDNVLFQTILWRRFNSSKRHTTTSIEIGPSPILIIHFRTKVWIEVEVKK